MSYQSNDPIFDTKFWADRLKDAKRRGYIHLSIFAVGPNEWSKVTTKNYQEIDANVPTDANVLDVGCGYGRLSEKFKNYTGIDISPDFVKEARRTYPDKTFIVGDIRNMPFKDQEFDWAIAISMKQMIIGRKGVEVWDECQKEIKRVAKKLLVVEYDSGGTKDYPCEII